MLQEETQIEKSNFNIATVSRIVVVTLAVAGAWMRIEHKMDEQSDRIIKRIDEHILSDKFEKQIIKSELESKITELSQRLDRAEKYGEQFVSKEFIRPSETRMEKNKRRYN